MVAPLQHELDRLGTRGVGEERELLERRLGGLDVARADAGADEQRALPDDAEVDLGRGEAPAGHQATISVSGDLGQLDLDVEHVDDRTAEADGVAELDDEVAAGDVHDDALAHQPAPVGDGGDRARAGAAAQRLAHPTLPDPHVELVVGAGRDAHELDVGAASGTGRRARGADRAG